jgi:sulfhydrogenase subunit gamma (sulfur reductase)
MAAARVAEVSDAGEGLIHVSLSMPPEVEASFTLPGQYLELSLPGHGARPYAIASAPLTGPIFEFLVRRGFPLADAIALLKPGAEVGVSKAMGPGFPMESVKGMDLLLVATGTGAAPMRAVIHSIANDRDAFGDVVFYFGGRHGRDFAFEKDWPRWEGIRVKLVRTVSEIDPHWKGLRGFVQDHFGPVRWQQAAAFVVGSNPMVQAVTAELVKRGMPRERIFLNL